MTEILKTTRQLLPFLVALFSLILHLVHGHGELTVPQSRNNVYKYVVNASLEMSQHLPVFSYPLPVFPLPPLQPSSRDDLDGTYVGCSHCLSAGGVNTVSKNHVYSK